MRVKCPLALSLLGRERMKLPNGTIEIASSQACKSPLGYRHGAVVFKGNKILGAGYNWPKALPGGENRQFSIHSERDALKGLRKDQIRGSDMFCIRVTRGGNYGLAAPCLGCQKLLKRKGIRKVHWLDDQGKLVSLKLN